MITHHSGTSVSPIQIELLEKTLIVRLPEEWPVLSWAPYNGGFTKASALLNLEMDHNTSCKDVLETGLLDRLIAQRGLPSNTVCFFTAARVAHYQESFLSKGTAWVHVISTVGLSNARAIGDEADVPLQDDPRPAGTINLWVGCNALPDLSGMVEAVQIAAAAKTAALRQIGVRSQKSREPAAGTGTDCIAVVASGEIKKNYCGLHTVFGELIGKAVLEAVSKGAKENLSRLFAGS